MLPRLSFNDLATTVHTDEERFHGRLILGHIENQTDFEFRYLGGRNPGNSRRVLPILLFSKIELSRPATDLHMIYLLAFCHTRQQTRTFRLDRISSS